MSRTLSTQEELCGPGYLCCEGCPPLRVHYFLVLTAGRGHLCCCEEPAAPLYAAAAHRLVLEDGRQVSVSLQHCGAQPLAVYTFTCEPAHCASPPAR